MKTARSSSSSSKSGKGAPARPPIEASLDLVAAVMATGDTFLRESQRLFRPHGLTAAQYNVINILANTPAGISQRELGDRLVVDRSNVTGLLDRLEKSNWVRRDDHPGDRRVYRISLTPAGVELWRKVTPLYLESVTQITRTLSAQQVKLSLEVLKQLEVDAKAWELLKK